MSVSYKSKVIIDDLLTIIDGRWILLKYLEIYHFKSLEWKYLLWKYNIAVKHYLRKPRQKIVFKKAIKDLYCAIGVMVIKMSYIHDIREQLLQNYQVDFKKFIVVENNGGV